MNATSDVCKRELKIGTSEFTLWMRWKKPQYFTGGNKNNILYCEWGGNKIFFEYHCLCNSNSLNLRDSVRELKISVFCWLGQKKLNVLTSGKKERSKKVIRFDRSLEITLDLECLKKYNQNSSYVFWYA